VLIAAGLGVEDDDRVGKEVLALARADVEVGRRIAPGNIQEPRCRVQSERCPSSPAADRGSGDVLPRRIVERRGALWAADRIAFGFGHQVEFPDDLAGLGVERVHAALSALFITPRIADEDETLPGDRRRGHGLALLWIGDRGLPEPLAGLEV